ncbi:MAG: hypothetical protein AVDCRST_MAG56-7754 [uncultured Cytophagales bacterium]|uniref:Uncharacterized protein n=1 Tax=uncultured Cytophagales bacterium TaxID=158755 RepID=A0A6J4LN37_9SPHI|nr:MAG: hypothetical protein AVDCRST_MAG56-7754 [uncultured Cytophagales bacterium]
MRKELNCEFRIFGGLHGGKAFAQRRKGGAQRAQRKKKTLVKVFLFLRLQRVFFYHGDTEGTKFHGEKGSEK